MPECVNESGIDQPRPSDVLKSLDRRIRAHLPPLTTSPHLGIFPLAIPHAPTPSIALRVPRLARACPLPRALCVGAHLVPRPAPRPRPASTSNRHAAQKDWEVRVVLTAHALGACVRGAVIHTAALLPLVPPYRRRRHTRLAAFRRTARAAREREGLVACVPAKPRPPSLRGLDVQGRSAPRRVVLSDAMDERDGARPLTPDARRQRPL